MLQFEGIKRLNNHYKLHRIYVQSIKDEVAKLSESGCSTDEIVPIIQKKFECYFDHRFVRKYRRKLTAKFECPVCHEKLLSAKYRYIHIIGRAEKLKDDHLSLVEEQHRLIESYKNNVNAIVNDKRLLLHIDYAIKYLQRNGLGNVICAACGEGFRDEKSYASHLKQRNTDGYSDKRHLDFLKNRNGIIASMLNDDKSIVEIQQTTNAGKREIHSISRKISKFKCEFCDNGFQNINALKNHIKMSHPEYIKSIEELVLNEFVNHIAIGEIIKRHSLLIGQIELINIWKMVFTKEQIKERRWIIYGATKEMDFASGKTKIWCDGLTALTSPILASAGYKTSKTKRKQGIERGIQTDKYDKDPLDTLYFNRIKKQVAKRDEYKCKKCGVEKGSARMDTHHIIPHRFSKCDFMSNLIYLCSRCHTRLHQNIVKLEKSEMGFYERCDIYIGGLDDFLIKPLTYYQRRYRNDPQFRDKQKEKAKEFRKKNPDYIKNHLSDPAKKQAYTKSIKSYLNSRQKTHDKQTIIL